MATKNHWEDEFDADSFADYKEAAVEHGRLRQENSVEGWIYVGRDSRCDDEAKIGLTTGKPGTRASSPQNPRFSLHCAFKVKEGVSPERIEEIEAATKAALSQNFERIPHETSGFPSEWFKVSPKHMREFAHEFLYDNFSSEMHCYHCPERDIGVIYSWENNRSLIKGKPVPYAATDLSNPPVDSACLTPPGCGADCNCWA